MFRIYFTGPAYRHSETLESDWLYLPNVASKTIQPSEEEINSKLNDSTTNLVTFHFLFDPFLWFSLAASIPFVLFQERDI